MRKSRLSEAQIVAILREFDAGASAEELARRNGIHHNAIRIWRSKYAGMSASDLAPQTARGRECPNAAHHCTTERQDRRHGRVDAKKFMESSRRAEAVRALQTLGLSQREACSIVRVPSAVEIQAPNAAGAYYNHFFSA